MANSSFNPSKRTDVHSVHPTENEPQLGSVAVYFPTIPETKATARFQHIIALLDASETVLVISNSKPPKEIQNRASEIKIVSGGLLAKAQRARKIAKSHVGRGGTYVTSFHYEAALSGYLASRDGVRWVADLFDAPVQYRLNNPGTHHEITSRGVEQFLHRAKVAVHSCSPETPFTFGRDGRFLSNGAPTTMVEPMFPNTDVLSMAWVGSPRMNRGGDILLEALNHVEAPIKVDVVGSNYEKVETRAQQMALNNQVTFHGRVPHDEALKITSEAHFGFCVLPDRPDWQYATPIKVGEYLAAGTIPLLSDFSGMHYMAGDAGQYMEPNPTALAAAIGDLNALDRERLIELHRITAQRADKIGWSKVRPIFSHLVARKIR